MVVGLIRSAIDHHDHLMDKYGDPRTKDWLLMSGPLPTISLCLGYIFIVKYLGPNLMENRKPFELKKTMIIYNAIMVVFSSYAVYEGVMGGWWNDYSFRCQPCDFSNSPKALRMARNVWAYFFSKFVEFLDTFFFVLRKKDKQISTLHVIHHAIMPIGTWPGVKFYPGGHITLLGTINSFVHVVMYSYYLLAALGPGIQKYLWWKKYITTMQIFFFVLRKKDKQISTLHVIHHAIMPIGTWPGVKFYPGGHITLLGTINSFVHVVMYSYYLLAALGPGIQKYLWWKKYITTMQIVQFVLIFIHSFQLFFIDCTVPIFFAWSIVAHAVLFFALFRRFYNEAYASGDKSKTKTAIEKMNMCMPALPNKEE